MINPTHLARSHLEDAIRVVGHQLFSIQEVHTPQGQNLVIAETPSGLNGLDATSPDKRTNPEENNTQLELSQRLRILNQCYMTYFGISHDYRGARCPKN